MTQPWYESLVALRPERVRCLLSFAPTLFAGGPAASHRLVWSLFGERAEQRRDFLFRVVADRPLRVVIRSARPPEDPFDLWTIQSRPFAPRLAQGQSLRFRVLAVPTVQERRPDGARSRRRSVVMDLPGGDPEERREAAEEAALAWIATRGVGRGFALRDAALLEARRIGVPRDRGEPMVLGTAEIEGGLTVTNPDAFAALLREGLGPNRAFGYGLVEVAPDRGSGSLTS